MIGSILSVVVCSAAPDARPLPPDGVSPFEDAQEPAGPPAKASTPFGHGPPRPRAVPLHPRHTLMTRLDFLVGTMWRTQRLDTQIGTSLEVGQMSGFSGTFHTELIIGTSQTNPVQALDVPIGLGAVARGRLRNYPLYGSIGASVGILVHRAATDGRVIHRVDPDFRFPIRFAWSISNLGISLALVQGYSIRSRTYESRGLEVWQRDAYRVGVLIGLHWDKVVGRTKVRGRR